jgi:amino acid adenylation domain-containing protein/FkbM family methyltransferase
MDEIIRSSDQDTATTQVLLAGDNHDLLKVWNQTATSFPDSGVCLHRLIEQQALRTPDQPAVAYERQTLTYSELNRRANRLAQHLRTLGAGPEVIIGLLVERSVEMIVGLLGILKAGCAYLPIDPAFPQERIAFMLGDANARIVLTQSSLATSLSARAMQVLCLDVFDWNRTEQSEQGGYADSQPENLAYVIYTSGSTGTPKGVCIEHRNIVNYVLGITERFQFQPGMNHATVSTVAADLGNTAIFPALITGGCLHVISKERAESQALLSEYFQCQKIDVLKIVPSHLAALQTGKDPQQVIPRRRLILGGESSRCEWISRLRELSPTCEIYNHYGPTETTVGVLTYDANGELPYTDSGTLPLGRPLPNSRVYILDEQKEPVPVGVPGELYIGGLGVARGYLNRPDLTAARFAPDPFGPDANGRLYRTGDLARYLPDGSIEFCGRTDNQVKIHGNRVELGEIEGSVREHGGVRDAVALAREDAAGNKQLVAYVIPKRSEQGLWANKSVYVLPDGSPVAHLNKNETSYIYKEIFVLQAYLRHGITIGDGDCILDAGANIGLFTVFASRLAKNLRIISFEPNPSVYACVKANAETWGTGVTCLPVGLSSENKTAELTFFEGFSLLSGFYADEATEREVVKTYALNQEGESSGHGEWAEKIDALLEDRFRARTVSARLVTLSSVIAEQGLDRIDLLKINVEKSELDVLLGLKSTDWPKIRQLVIEVDQRESVEPITTLLEKQGYDILVEQDPLLRKTELCYVYAIRPSAEHRLIREQPADAHLRSLPAAVQEILTPATLRQHLKDRLPQYMVPSAFVLMDRFPLTANGKLDRAAFPAPSQESDCSAADFLEPRNDTERQLAAIWRELLNVERIGINDDFFELGGHSLLAIKAASRIRDTFGVDLQTQALFENTTIASLAGVLRTTTAPSGGIERRPSDRPCALSFSQEQLWILNQLAPGSPVYNIVDVVHFDGSCQGATLTEALRELVRRHEVLRTVFSHRNGPPMQTVLPTIDIPLPEVDLSALTEAQREQEWTRLVREEGRKTFDLSQAPLLRTTLVHFSPREHRLLLTIHHIIADEWSMELIQQEIHQLHEELSSGRKTSLPELPIQYTDFARWQRDWLQGPALQEQISYWKRELAGAPSVLELPADKPRPAVQSFRGATEMFQLPRELRKQLKILGRTEQATLFMVLEAGFAVLLHRYTGQKDILVGTPISGRTHSETERLIGCFLNTVVLRAQFDEHLTFRALLKQARERAVGAYGHPDLPLEHLVAELMPERDSSRTPLFQVMFVLHDNAGTSRVSKASGNHELETGTSKFDLTLILSESESGLEGMVEYSTDLFEAETIRRLCSHYATLLERVVRDPDESVATVPMLTDAERQQLLMDHNNTTVMQPGQDRCLHELIEEQARRTPDGVALADDQQTLTYMELIRMGNQLAHHLRGLGVRPGAVVGLLVDRSVQMVVGLLGILKAGAAYVPLDPAFPMNRLSYMVEDSKMSVLITQRDLEGTLHVRPRVVVRLDTDSSEILKQSKLSTGLPEVDQKSLAYVLYTSGSTGRPKGVMISHSAIANFLLSMRREPGCSSKDTLLAVTTLSFDIAGLELYLPLVSGAKVVITSREDAIDPSRLQKRIRESGCTIMQATPATWRALIHAGWGGSAGLKVLCGGEPLPRELAKELLPRCGELWNMYGPTETTVWSTVHRVASADAPLPIGRAIANTQVYVLDGYRNLLPIGVVGELYIGGDGLARGYWQRQELTQERFVPNPFAPNTLLYRTGDLARWRPDGTLECLARMDNQVKIRGFRIELGEIEAILGSHEAIRQCAVIAREDVPGNKELVAYFETREGSAPDLAVLRAHLTKDLPAYMIPSVFVHMESWPLTPNGKLDRKSLPAPTQRVTTAGDFLAPRDLLEQLLAQIWSKALNVKRVGLRDNFFDLGGHSLLAVRVMVETGKLCNTQLPLALLLQAPTIAELAEILRAKHWTPSWSSLVPIRPTGSKAPLFLIHSHGGNVLEYHPLVRLMDADQPVYALQARGLDGQITKNLSVEEMVAAYVNEIRSLQPKGPYFVGGFCLGGALALEAAQQLTAAGEEVALVAMIQTMHPEAMRFKPETTISQRLWYRAAKRISLEAENFSIRGTSYLVERGRRLWDRMRARAAMAVHALTGSSVSHASPLSMHVIFEILALEHGKLVQKYSPRQYDGAVVLFRASKQLSGIKADEFLGWKGVLNGNLEVLEAPGHQQNLLVEPNVSRLAQLLTAKLKAAQ